MAREGETEVFNVTPMVGRCYNYTPATSFRSVPKGGASLGFYRYFTKLAPEYVGQCTNYTLTGGAEGENLAEFELEGKRRRIINLVHDPGFFEDVACKPLAGGRRKRTRRARRKSKKTRSKSRN